MNATIYWYLKLRTNQYWLLYIYFNYTQIFELCYTCCNCWSPSSALNIDCAISVCRSFIFWIISLISYRRIPRKHNLRNDMTQYPNTNRMSAVCRSQANKLSTQPCNEKQLLLFLTFQLLFLFLIYGLVNISLLRVLIFQSIKLNIVVNEFAPFKSLNPFFLDNFTTQNQQQWI